jgi:hypothetical protein
MSLDFWACDRGHKHADEAHALECNRRAKLGRLMPPDEMLPVSKPGELPVPSEGRAGDGEGGGTV